MYRVTTKPDTDLRTDPSLKDWYNEPLLPAPIAQDMLGASSSPVSQIQQPHHRTHQHTLHYHRQEDDEEAGVYKDVTVGSGVTDDQGVGHGSSQPSHPHHQLELVGDLDLPEPIEEPAEEEDSDGPREQAEEGGGDHELPVPSESLRDAVAKKHEDDDLADESQTLGPAEESHY